MNVSRRKFFQNATTVTAGMILFGVHKNQGASAAMPELIKIEKPFHGAVLNSRHGEKVQGGLKIEVQGEAPLNGMVAVNKTQVRQKIQAYC